MLEYKVRCRGKIKGDNADLKLILSTYNFSFWFNGENGFIQLDRNGNVIAMISIGGVYRIYSCTKLSCKDHVDKLYWSLGLRENLNEFHETALKDPLLREFISKYPGWRLRSTSLWWALVVGVCQQNASFRQGWKMLYNIVKNYGRKIVLEDHETYLTPTPQDIIEKPELLKKSGTGYRWKTILSIAHWFLEHNVDCKALQRSKAEEIEEILKSIKGVGEYTARLALVLALRRYELPPVDRWLRKIISVVYGVSEKEAEDKWVSIWGRYSGLASVAVTVALDAEPLNKALKRIGEGKISPIEDNKITPLTMWKYL